MQGCQQACAWPCCWACDCCTRVKDATQGAVCQPSRSLSLSSFSNTASSSSCSAVRPSRLNSRRGTCLAPRYRPIAERRLFALRDRWICAFCSWSGRASHSTYAVRLSGDILTSSIVKPSCCTRVSRCRACRKTTVLSALCTRAANFCCCLLAGQTWSVGDVYSVSKSEPGAAGLWLKLLSAPFRADAVQDVP